MNAMTKTATQYPMDPLRDKPDTTAVVTVAKRTWVDDKMECVEKGGGGKRAGFGLVEKTGSAVHPL